MATEHILNLKAQLDVTELQQQLNLIRSQMTLFKNNVTGGQRSTNTQSAPSRNIESSLKGLQSSIDRLNQSINRVGQLQNRMMAANQGRSKFHLADAEAIRNTRLSRLNKRYGLRPADMSNMQRSLLRAGRAFAGSQVLGMVGDLLTALGHTTAGSVVSGLSEGAGAGAMTAAALSKFAIGGPAGLIVGFGVATTKIVDALKESAERISKASDEAYKILTAGKARIQQHIQNVDEMKYNDSLNKMTSEGRRKELSSTTIELEKAKQHYYDLTNTKSIDFRKIAWQYLADANSTEAGSEERVAIERKYGEAVVAYAESLDKAKLQLDKLTDKQQMLEKLVQNDIEDQKKRDTEIKQLFNEQMREAERKQAYAIAYEQKRTALRGAASDIVTSLGRDTERNRVAHELFGIQYDENGREKKTSPLEQFRLASKMLDDYRALRITALSLAKSQAANALDLNMPNEARENLIKQSQSNIEQAQHLAGVIGQIESFISNINTQPNWKPNMENVTSLAQYGFSMGEHNDNIDRLERYYRNMEDLTTQIRNKLQEGIRTESTYN